MRSWREAAERVSVVCTEQLTRVCLLGLWSGYPSFGWLQGPVQSPSLEGPEEGFSQSLWRLLHPRPFWGFVSVLYSLDGNAHS